MENDVKQDTGAGATISLQIPARDSGLFKNKATNDVLLLLTRHRFDGLTIGEIAEQTGHTKPTVGRAVDTLEANDLVWETNEGNRRLIQINRDRLSVPNDPFLEIPQVEFHEPVKAAVDELTERLEDVVGIILYGSVARGEADRRSDIDLWVLVGEDRPANQREANAVQVDLEERTFENNRYGYDIDVEAVASIPAYTSDIREIVVSGIIVYETPNFETIRNLLRNETASNE